MKRGFLVLVMILNLLAFGSAMLYSAQRMSQETRDALQDQEIHELDSRVIENSQLTRQNASDLVRLSSAMDRFTGIGIGFGAALTLLQAVQLVLQIRKRTA